VSRQQRNVPAGTGDAVVNMSFAIGESGRPAVTTIACLFSVRTTIPPPTSTPASATRADEAFNLQRFAPHFGDRTASFSRFVVAHEFQGVPLATSRGVFAPSAAGRLYGVFTPASSTVLLLVIEMEADFRTTLTALQETCHRREELQIDGTLMFPTLCDEVLWPAGHAVAFDRDVHQIVVPAITMTDDLGRRTRSGERRFDLAQIARLVYREDQHFHADRTGVRYPTGLNRARGSLAAHSRGVTVLVGLPEYVEWAVVFTAAEVTAAVACLRAIRSTAIAALERAGTVDSSEHRGLTDRRRRLTTLTRELGDLQLQLSFGVEAYLDNLRLPEVVLQDYRDSLAEVTRLASAAEGTAAMLTRLADVLVTRKTEIQILESRIADVRRRRHAVAIGYVTLVAAPLSVILAFLGTNSQEVSTRYSIFDWDHYGWFYIGSASVFLLGAVLYLLLMVWAALAIIRVEREIDDTTPWMRPVGREE
jgi:hypothetical protein